MRRLAWCAAVMAMGCFSTANVSTAGRPLAIDDADPVDRGHYEAEAGCAYEHVSDCKHWDFPFGLAYGLVTSVEASLGFGGQFEERTELLEDGATEHCTEEHGISDLVIGAKWQFLESFPLGARQALAPAVKLPTADEDAGLGSDEADCDLTWIASRSIGKGAGAHINLGYSWIGGPDDDVLHYGAALDCQVVDAVQWVGEVFAEQAVTDGADPVVQFNSGFRWSPVDSLTLDVAGGSEVSGEAPDFTATAGLTWGFGFRQRATAGGA